MFLIFPLAQAALRFGPPEYFSLIWLGMTILIYLAKGSVGKATVVVLFGFILSSVGIDSISGVPRFAFGIRTERSLSQR
jgi:putative tricarboxylic transport membrane protein